RRTDGGTFSPLLQKIDEPAVRAVFTSLVAENSRLHGQVNQLKRITTVEIDRRASATLVAAPGPMDALPIAHVLTYSQLEALRAAISAETFSVNNWTENPDGSVTNSAGRVIYDPGYVTGLRTLLKGDEQ